MSGFAQNFLKKCGDGSIDLDTAEFRVVAVDVTSMGAGNGGLITGCTTATPGVVTSTSHGMANGERCCIGQVGGITFDNAKGGHTAGGGVFKVANVAANTFEVTDVLDDTDVQTTGTYTSQGAWILADATIDDLADIPAGARKSDLVQIAAAGLTFIKGGGVLDVADYSLTGIANLDDVQCLLYYKHDAVEGSAHLVYFDLDDSGLPFVGNGQNVSVTVNANGLFAVYR